MDVPYNDDCMCVLVGCRRQLKNAECSADWSRSVSGCVTTGLKADNTTVGNFINVMRPTAVRLIADTTIVRHSRKDSYVYISMFSSSSSSICFVRKSLLILIFFFLKNNRNLLNIKK